MTARESPPERQCWPYDAGNDDPWAGILPGQLRDPVAGFGANSYNEQDDVNGPIAKQACSDGKNLAEGKGAGTDD